MYEKLFSLLKPVQVWLRGLVAPLTAGVQAIVLDTEGRAILVEHTYCSGLHLPGGAIARPETGEEAIWRELSEEIGLVSGAPPELFGFYRRGLGWAENYIAVYIVRDAKIAFKRSFEIARIQTVDPDAPQGALSPGAQKRLAEFTGRIRRSGVW